MQQELLKRVKYMIAFYGTTQQFIAQNVGVNRSTINLFLKGERILAPVIENRLNNFLNEKNIKIDN